MLLSKLRRSKKDTVSIQQVNYIMKSIDSLLYMSCDGIFMVDRKWNIVSFCCGFADTLKIKESQHSKVEGMSLVNVINMEESNKSLIQVKESSKKYDSYVNKTDEIDVLNNIEVKSLVDRGISNREDIMYVVINAVPILDFENTFFGKPKFAGFMGTIRDVTEKRDKKIRIMKKTYIDSTTGVYNRAYYEEKISLMESECSLYPISIVVGDVNGLKLTNDAFGHEKGDELLIRIANVLKNGVRKTDMVFRWGGDEFAILMPNTEIEDARKLSKRLSSQVRELKLENLVPGISLGVACKYSTDIDFETVFREADKAMYVTKEAESDKIKRQLTEIIEKQKNNNGSSDELDF